MKKRPAFKTARRLGAPIFEKTQSQKYAAWEAKKPRERRKRMSDYGKQMIEKQKARFTYGVTEKQFRRYVDEAMNTEKPATEIFAKLESRLDNVAYRVGLAPTRRAARQMVSHGHILVNGKRTNVPSQKMSEGDTFSIREGSKQNKLFVEKETQIAPPQWIDFDKEAGSGKVSGTPDLTKQDLMFDLDVIIEFYNR